MDGNNYKVIEVKLGSYIKKFEMRENYIGTFVVGGTLYNAVGTKHSIDRLEGRGLNKYHVLSSIVGLGEKLTNYNNSGKHIIISDEQKEISTVFTIENSTVVLITVLDKDNMLASYNVDQETVIETYDNVG